MKPSQRLSPLLKLYGMRRRVLKQLMASLRTRKEALVQSLAELGRQWDELRSAAREGLQAGWEPDRAALHRRYLEGLQRKQESLRGDLDGLTGQMRDAEQRLIRAAQDLQLLASLQERRLKREKWEEERQTEIQIEDLVRSKQALEGR